MAKKKRVTKKRVTDKAATAKKITPKKRPASTTPPKSKDKRRRRAKSSDSPSPLRVDSRPFPIVGLGASAGGLEALEEFFRHMPADSGMAFVVVMHQAASHVSLLPELLGKHTKMNVVPISDRMPVQPNNVYIVPPGKYVDLFNGTLMLTDLPEKYAAKLPIDHFFRSLAEERSESAVAIVLSGTGTDGTVGLSAIKGESGMVMVQSVESAKFGGMPQHAIDSGWADFVLSPGEMPARLIAYARGPFLKAPPSFEPPAPAIQQALPEILFKLRRHCGHDFSGYKSSTICRRIERRMNIHQIDEPRQYLKLLDQHETEAETLFKELLIGVTSFFRDPWAFESLVTRALMPRLRERSDESQFRVWVPGCATGEEVYSIAILLRECMDELKIGRNVQVFGTDLDADAVEKAREGAFSSGIGTDVSARRLNQFFTKDDGHYRIRKELRDWLVFAPQNIIHDPPFTKLDLISCRNLLIYLQADLQKKILALFHYSLKPGGYLFLGTSESVSDFGDLFETIDARAKLFRRKESVLRPDRQVRFPVVGKKTDAGKEAGHEPGQLAVPPFPDSITQMLVSDFAPPTVVVTEGGEIVYVHGRTGQFLELPPGGSSKNVVAMAREGLQLELSSALRTAARQTGPVVHNDVVVKANGDTVRINLVVQKIHEPASIRGLLRVSFVTVTEMAPLSTEPTPEKSSAKKPKKQRMSELAREKTLQLELQRSRESLQRTIEQLDASNEEMKSTNEELQSTNEELQSTNEELETSKEELQSLNEELQTVNAELHEKIRELSISNDDMNNLLNSSDIATLFLDNGLCIKRFTEQAKKIVRVIPTDVGRSLRDLTSRLQYDNLFSDGERVLKNLVPIEREVQCDDDRWLLMRILPYRTSDDKIDGLVMTFVDIDESKRTRDEASSLMNKIVATVREPLLVLDADLRVRFANQSFFDDFRTTEKDTLGHFISDLGNGQWDIPALRTLLESILPHDRSFESFEVVREFPLVGRKRLLLNGRRISTILGKPNLILLAIEEVMLCDSQELRLPVAEVARLFLSPRSASVLAS